MPKRINPLTTKTIKIVSASEHEWTWTKGQELHRAPSSNPVRYVGSRRWDDG